MKGSPLASLILLGVLTITCIQATAGLPSKVTREVIEETLEQAARRSGREISEQTAKKATTETLEHLTKTYGDDVLTVVRDGGIELIEAVPKHSDDVIEIALKATPAGRRALARNLPDILPLARRVGAEVLELEARTPGLAAKVFATFGDDAGRLVAKNVPTEDLPRLLSYAEKADTPATRDLLVQSYQKEGRSLFERIPPKLVLAGGLTASMLYGTHRLTEPADAMGDAIRNNGDVATTAVRHFFGWGAVCVLALATVLLWRFRLMPWQAKKKPTAERRKETKTGTSEQSPAPLRETRGGSREGEA